MSQYLNDDDQYPQERISTDSLCSKCKFGAEIMGEAQSQARSYCGNLHRWMPFKVSQCSIFLSRMTPSRQELEQIAWILETGKGSAIGFISPERRERRKQ